MTPKSAISTIFDTKIAKNAKFPRFSNLQRVARAWYESKKSKIAKNGFNNPETIIVYDIGSIGPVSDELGPIYCIKCAFGTFWSQGGGESENRHIYNQVFFFSPGFWPYLAKTLGEMGNSWSRVSYMVGKCCRLFRMLIVVEKSEKISQKVEKPAEIEQTQPKNGENRPNFGDSEIESRFWNFGIFPFFCIIFYILAFSVPSSMIFSLFSATMSILNNLLHFPITFRAL